MKKTVEVKVPEKVIKRPARVDTKEIINCDICGKEVDVKLDNHYGSGGHNCALCGRDVCRNRKAAYTPTCFKFGGNEWDDSNEKYCIICFELKFKKYQQAYDLIEENHEKQLQKLELMIKRESLNES